MVKIIVVFKGKCQQRCSQQKLEVLMNWLGIEQSKKDYSIFDDGNMLDCT